MGNSYDVMFFLQACVLRGESVGTAFLPAKIAAKGKKKWILAVPIHGTIKVDRAGANAVIRGLPLLTTHVTECDGSFRVQECVRIVNEDGQEIARGLCNYNSQVLIRKRQGLRLFRAHGHRGRGPT